MLPKSKNNNKNKEVNNKKLQCQGKCQKIKAKNGNNFYKSNNPAHQNEYYGGYAPICKGCLRSETLNADNKTVNMDGLLKVLELLDKPYIQEEYIKVLNKCDGVFDLGEYSKDITFCYPKLGYKDSDIFHKNNKINNTVMIDNEIEEKDLQELKEIWGEGFNQNQYQRLENFYNEFASEYETDLPAQRLNFRNAARTQLQIEEALKNNETNLFNSLTKTLSTILGDSNVKPVQATGAEANDQLCWGLFVKKAEEEEPIEDWKNDEIKKYIDTFMIGHLAKMEGLHNEFTDMYDEAIKPWSVDFSGITNTEDEE